MNQNCSFKKKYRRLLISEEKCRTIRPVGKNNYRDKVKVGDTLHIFIELGSKNSEHLLDRKVKKKYSFELKDVPNEEDIARRKESVIEGETWFLLAEKEGFNRYCEFYEFLESAPEERFIIFIWEKVNSKNSFFVNEFLHLKLENNEVKIYVNGIYFQQCKYLLFNIKKENAYVYDHIESIDEMKDFYSDSNEGNKIKIDPQSEFWGHCSNLQTWFENDYDTRILHSSLAFPLLKRLYVCGDPIAKKRFKEEIAKRFISGYKNTQLYLLEQNYLDFLSYGEIRVILESLDPRSEVFNKSSSLYYNIKRIEIPKYLETFVDPSQDDIIHISQYLDNFSFSILKHINLPNYRIHKKIMKCFAKLNENKKLGLYYNISVLKSLKESKDSEFKKKLKEFKMSSTKLDLVRNWASVFLYTENLKKYDLNKFPFVRTSSSWKFGDDYSLGKLLAFKNILFTSSYRELGQFHKFVHYIVEFEIKFDKSLYWKYLKSKSNRDESKPAYLRVLELLNTNDPDILKMLRNESFWISYIEPQNFIRLLKKDCLKFQFFTKLNLKRRKKVYEVWLNQLRRKNKSIFPLGDKMLIELKKYKRHREFVRFIINDKYYNYFSTEELKWFNRITTRLCCLRLKVINDQISLNLELERILKLKQMKITDFFK